MDKRVPGMEFVGKRMPAMDLVVKRVPGMEFVGKRSPRLRIPQKRVPSMEFFGKRFGSRHIWNNDPMSSIYPTWEIY